MNTNACGQRLYLIFAVAILLLTSKYNNCTATTTTTTIANQVNDKSHEEGKQQHSYNTRSLRSTTTSKNGRNLQPIPIVAVTEFELYNAITDEKIMNIIDGQVINMKMIVGLTEPAFNINIVTSGTPTLVQIGYNTNIYNYRIERSAPYAFCGNNGSNFLRCTELSYGTHIVHATPKLPDGTFGTTVSIQFTIITGTSVVPVSPPVIVATPTMTPTKIPITAAPVPVPVPIVVPVPVPVPSNAPVPVPVPSNAPVPVPVPIAAPVPQSTPSSVLSSIQALTLMYTGVNPSKSVLNLTFDEINVIDLRLLPFAEAEFNIDARVSSNVKSVVFSNGRIETSAPLAYCGNFGLDFYTCDDLVEGARQTITVTAYPERGGSGVAIESRSTTVHIVRSLPPVAPTAPVVAPIAAPISPPVTGCPVPKLLGSWTGSKTGSTIPYPISVAEAQGTMIGRDFVITSGFKNGYSSATPETYALDMYTPNAAWRRMDDMPFPLGLTHLGVAVKGMKAYFCGGYVGGSLGIHNGSCFQYDHSIAPGNGQQWTNFTSIPDGGRSGGGMIYDSTIDALIYSAGSHRPIKGRKNAIDFDDTFMYSLNNPSEGWVRKTDIPFTGNHMNFVTALDENGTERHYFFGGQKGDNEATGNTNEMYEYNAITDTWIKRQNIPYPLGHAAATVRAIGCGFIVAGGVTNTGLTSAISYYDIPTNTWTKIGDLTNSIHTNVCVIANSYLRCETGWATGTFSWQRPISL